MMKNYYIYDDTSKWKGFIQITEVIACKNDTYFVQLETGEFGLVTPDMCFVSENYIFYLVTKDKF